MAVGFALVFGTAALIMIGFLWWATTGSLSHQTNDAIQEDADVIRHVYDENGLPGLTDAIDRRLEVDRDGSQLYLLATTHFTPITGSLTAWPLQIGYKAGWHEIAVVRGDHLVTYRVLYQKLPDGLHLLVGRDTNSIVRLQALILDAVVWSTGLAVLLAICQGLVFRQVFLARLRLIRATAEAFAHGDVCSRLADAGTHDEFDLLARAINDMLSRIEQLIGDVRNVSNAVAHDLRTPLTEVRVQLNTLRSQCADRPDLQTTVDQAIADVDRLVAIFTALLRLVEIDSGSRRSSFSPVDLGAVVEDIGEFYQALAETKGIICTVTTEAGLMVRGDRDLLSQAVGNLIDNAIKFTPEKGTIVVIAVAAAPDRADVIVGDTGPGIPEAERPKVTERFYRGDRSRTTPGTGLGLSLVKAVTELHHGMLELTDNQPGLQVRLHFPRLVRASPEQSARLEGQAGPPIAG